MWSYKNKEQKTNFFKSSLISFFIILILSMNISNTKEYERNMADQENIGFLNDEYLQNYVKEKSNIEMEIKNGVLALKDRSVLKNFKEIPFVDYYNESNQREGDKRINYRASYILLDFHDNNYTHAFYKKDNMFLYLAHEKNSDVVGVVSVKFVDVKDKEFLKTIKNREKIINEHSNIDFIEFKKDNFDYMVAQFNRKDFIDEMEKEEEVKYIKSLAFSILTSLYLFFLSYYLLSISSLFSKKSGKRNSFKSNLTNLFNFKKKRKNLMKIKQIEMKRRDTEITEKIEDKKFAIKIKND